MSTGSKPTFTVQSFREKGRGLEAEPPQQANDEAHALRKVERMAIGKAGAVAIRQEGHPALGDFGDMVILKVVGRVPSIYTDADLIPF